MGTVDKAKSAFAYNSLWKNTPITLEATQYPHNLDC